MKIYRLAPCPIYDIDGMQNWLETMASKGLFLTKSFLFTAFERGEAREVRYRIEPLPKKSEAHEEAIAMIEACGWTHIKTERNFAIYMTENAQAPELHSDDEIHLSVYERLIKEERWEILSAIIGILPAIFIIFRYGFFLTLVELGPGVTFFFLLTIITHTIKRLSSYFYIQKSKREFIKKQSSRYHSFSYRVFNVICNLSFILTVLFLLTCREQRMPVATYQEKLPFLTMEDLYPNAIIKQNNTYVDINDKINTVKTYRNGVVHQAIDYQEDVYVQLNDSNQNINFRLKVEYYDLKYGWLTNYLAKDLYHFDHKDDFAKDMTYQNLPNNVLYTYDKLGSQIFIMVKEYQVIKVDIFPLAIHENLPEIYLDFQEIIDLYTQAN